MKKSLDDHKKSRIDYKKKKKKSHFDHAKVNMTTQKIIPQKKSQMTRKEPNGHKKKFCGKKIENKYIYMYMNM